ncbi:MAG: L,D-transpeptidase [Verrucomicrobia bacterium]|nr:L,D-transpeptidase [Verrucomicrobiota bacterium]
MFAGKREPATTSTPAPTVKAVPVARKPAVAKDARPQKPKPLAKAEQRERYARLQIYLDRAQFAPGKITGQWDILGRRAWARYQAAKGLAPSDPTVTPPAELANLGPTYVTYQVRAADAAQVGELAGKAAEQSKAKRMPYSSLAEMITERFHCAPEFLAAINPGVNLSKLKVGDTVNVPNVVPFDLSGMIVERARLAAQRAERAKQAQQAQLAQAANPAGPVAPGAVVPPPVANPTTNVAEPPPIDPNRYQITVLTGEKQLEIRENGKLVASFPVTPGGTTLPTPKGNWVVRSKVFLPEFRHDKSMLNTGKRSDDFRMIPPGPNNPVGVMWMGLSKDGIGLHGTNSPNTISRAASHGCVRLANWDAVRVAQFVEKGTKVTVE